MIYMCFKQSKANTLEYDSIGIVNGSLAHRRQTIEHFFSLMSMANTNREV